MLNQVYLLGQALHEFAHIGETRCIGTANERLRFGFNRREAAFDDLQRRQCAGRTNCRMQRCNGLACLVQILTELGRNCGTVGSVDRGEMFEMLGDNEHIDHHHIGRMHFGCCHQEIIDHDRNRADPQDTEHGHGNRRHRDQNESNAELPNEGKIFDQPNHRVALGLGRSLSIFSII